MAVGVRDGSEQVTGGNFLRTGATLVEVAVVAPTIEQMKTILGFDDPKEPGSPVDTDEKGNPRVRIDVWIQRPEDKFQTKIAFFLVKADSVASTGKIEWVNNKGQFCYGPKDGGDPNYEWFDLEGARKAFQGERTFINWLRALTNHKGGKTADDMYLDTWDAIFAGNFAEINSIITAANQKGNRFGMLFGVRTSAEGKQYQGVYMKLFTRQYGNLFGEFQGSLNGEYGAYKHDYQNSLVWQPYGGNATVGTPEGATAAGSDDGAAPWK